MVMNLSANAGDTGDKDSILALGRSPGEGNGKLTPAFLPERFHVRGDWRATVHGVTKRGTQQSTRTAYIL